MGRGLHFSVPCDRDLEALSAFRSQFRSRLAHQAGSRVSAPQAFSTWMACHPLAPRPSFLVDTELPGQGTKPGEGTECHSHQPSKETLLTVHPDRQRSTEIKGRHQGNGPNLQGPEASRPTDTVGGVSLKTPGSAAAPLRSGKASSEGPVPPLN